MQKKTNLQQICQKMDWAGDTVAHLRQKLKFQMRSGINLNAISKRIRIIDTNVPKVEEYTLYDLVMEESYRDHRKTRDNHWFAVMSMLRGLGAKPACQLISQMSPEQKANNELDSLNLLKNWACQRINAVRSLREQKR